MQTGCPQALIKHLENNAAYSVKQVQPGEYFIDNLPIQIQIVDINYIDKEKFIWLNGLRKNLTNDNIKNSITTRVY